MWKKYLSRKLGFSAFSVVGVLFSVSQASHSGLPNEVLVVALPVAILCITIICVSYVTGQAKIDVQASYGKKE